MITKIPDIKTVASSEIIQRGDKGLAVKLVQEWLTLRGHTTAIDEDFGSATVRAVKAFQQTHYLGMDEIVGAMTWNSLWDHMRVVLDTGKIIGIGDLGGELNRVALAIAQICKNVNVHELGQNQGPWVRLFFSQDPVNGYDGKDYLWCGAMVRFCIEQALNWLELEPDKLWDYETGWSCDNTGTWAAKQEILFYDASPDTVKPGSIFLVKKSVYGWRHMGFVESYDHDEGVIVSIEGNSNSDGSNNGTHVVRRYRSVKNLNFITGYSGKPRSKNISRTTRELRHSGRCRR